MTSPLTAAGLILDGVGAATLAAAFVFKRPRQAYEETKGYWGRNPYLYRSLAMQAADAWVAGALLVAGFALQLAVALGAQPSWPLGWAVASASLVAAGALATLRWVLRPFAVGRAITWDLHQAWIEREASGLGEEKAIADWWAGVSQWGAVLGRPRADGEALADYGARVVGARGWRRVGGKPLPPGET